MSDTVDQVARDIDILGQEAGLGYSTSNDPYSVNAAYSGYGGSGVSRIVSGQNSTIYDAGLAGGSNYSTAASGYGVSTTGYGLAASSIDADNYSTRLSTGFNRINDEFVSKTEAAILNAASPLSSNENEEITVNGYRGVFVNKAEVDSWSRSSTIPISQYEINQDANPEIITKRADQQVEYQQELSVRYLRPPTPPPPGEIIIKEENSVTASAPPPIIVRVRPPRPPTPEPVIIREAPPTPPKQVGRQVVKIVNKHVATAPRKVIVEKLPALPSKPQSIIVEKWLPYRQLKRKVIHQRAAAVDTVIAKPKNIIIQWELPAPVINKEYKYLGVINANPAEYVSRYGSSLKRSSELPTFISNVKVPDTLLTTVDYTRGFELEGDLEALKLVDLDREGLSEYRSYLQRYGYSSTGGASGASGVGVYSSGSNYSVKNESYLGTSSSNRYQLESLIDEVFREIDVDHSGSLDFNETSRLLLKLNSRLGRSYGEDEVKAFFEALDVDNNNRIDIKEFKRAFLNLKH